MTTSKYLNHAPIVIAEHAGTRWVWCPPQPADDQRGCLYPEISVVNATGDRAWVYDPEMSLPRFIIEGNAFYEVIMGLWRENQRLKLSMLAGVHPTDLPDDDRMPVTVDAGYMGDPQAWCYWSTEYPDEGAVGPFDSRQAAEEHARAEGHAP